MILEKKGERNIDMRGKKTTVYTRPNQGLNHNLLVNRKMPQLT